MILSMLSESSESFCKYSKSSANEAGSGIRPILQILKRHSGGSSLTIKVIKMAKHYHASKQ